MHIKILHNIYVTNSYLSKFLDIENICTFCNNEIESISHLFYQCSFSMNLWTKIERYVLCKTNISVKIDYKSVIVYFEHKNDKINSIVNLFILYGKFHIHKCRVLKIIPNFSRFSLEFVDYIKTLNFMNTSKSNKTGDIYNELFEEE